MESSTPIDVLEGFQTEQEEYTIKHNPRGRAVIINNYAFKKTRLDGYIKDQEGLKILFGDKLKFTCTKYSKCIHENQPAEEIKNIIRKESKRTDHGSADVFVMCILSHGNKDHVLGTDDKSVNIVEEIYKNFNGKQCPALHGKPKLFFIQACQGGKMTEGYPEYRQSFAPAGSGSGLGPQVPRSHERSDILIEWATVPDFKAFVHPINGSLFINSIVDIFRKYRKHEDIQKMMTRVKAEVSKIDISTEEGPDKKQMPSTKENSLRKLMYFYPPDKR